MWRCYLMDTMTGVLRAPIDIPSFSWAMSISDSSLSTTRDKGTGEGEASSITVPWSAVPGDTPTARSSALSPARRSLALFWWTSEDGDGYGTPIIVGAIGQRKDTSSDTSFSLDSTMQMLASRLLVREGTFGADGGRTSSEVRLSGLSLRAIACEVVRLCTEAKPGGALPLDLPYLGERGGHERTYRGYDVGNGSCSKLLSELANVDGGPDITFRPYVADTGGIRFRLIAGSDADVYIGQSAVHRLSWSPDGGSLHDLEVTTLGACPRVYATGSGSEESQLCHLSEDMTLQDAYDPYPLAEEVLSSTGDERLDLLASHADARLSADGRPIAQFEATIDAYDSPAPLGSLWPGEVVELAVDGHPSVPDDVYRLRLMEMSGDAGTQVKLKFDVTVAPVY